jgi:hypothetical protein
MVGVCFCRDPVSDYAVSAGVSQVNGTVDNRMMISRFSIHGDENVAVMFVRNDLTAAENTTFGPSDFVAFGEHGSPTMRMGKSSSTGGG